MELSRTVGLAVAVSLVAGTVAAALAQISGAAPADPTANVLDADVLLIKPLPRTEQFETRVSRCSTSALGSYPWPLA
jgi:hypothetical protein